VKHLKTFAALTVALALTACGTKGATPTTSGSPIASGVPSPMVSNDIDPAAAKGYRDALKASLAAMQATGLTELTYDDTNALIDVVAYDPSNKRVVEQDVEFGDAEELDDSATMPSSLLDELDGLESGDSVDSGSIKSPVAGTFVVTSNLEDSSYVTTYTLDDQGRIATSKLVMDGDSIGVTKYVYELTKEAKDAFKAL
jgi:hypothetical protein